MDERDYMYDEYAKDARAKLNLGIRRRLAPLMENDRRRIELLNGMLMSLPGTPIIYYGDEIGMGDNIYLGDRNGVRTPMQWNGGWNAGFSGADPERLYSPLISNPLYGYQASMSTRRGVPALAALLDEATDPRAQVHARLQPRHDGVSASAQSSRAGLRARVRGAKILMVNNLSSRRKPPNSICAAGRGPCRSRCLAAIPFRASEICPIC